MIVELTIFIIFQTILNCFDPGFGVDFPIFLQFMKELKICALEDFNFALRTLIDNVQNIQLRYY